MARKKKDETLATQTAESLEGVVMQLEGMRGEITTLVELLRVNPAIPQVEVHYDRSRRDGLKSLRTWIDAARDSVIAARSKAIGERKTSVSAAPSETPKPSVIPLNGDRKRKPGGHGGESKSSRKK